MTPAQQAKAALSDWLAEVNWIVSFYSFRKNYFEDWFQRFLTTRKTIIVKDVTERYRAKNNPTLLAKFEQYCSAEMKQLAELVIKIRTLTTKAEIVECVLECYRIVHGSDVVTQDSTLTDFAAAK